MVCARSKSYKLVIFRLDCYNSSVTKDSSDFELILSEKSIASKKFKNATEASANTFSF